MKILIMRDEQIEKVTDIKNVFIKDNTVVIKEGILSLNRKIKNNEILLIEENDVLEINYEDFNFKIAAIKNDELYIIETNEDGDIKVSFNRKNRFMIIDLKFSKEITTNVLSLFGFENLTITI